MSVKPRLIIKDKNAIPEKLKRIFEIAETDSIQYEKRASLTIRMNDIERRKQFSFEKSFNVPNIFPTILNQKMYKKTKGLFMKTKDFDKILKKTEETNYTKNESYENLFKMIQMNKSDDLDDLFDCLQKSKSFKTNLDLENRKEIQNFKNNLLDFDSLFKNFETQTKEADKLNYKR